MVDWEGKERKMLKEQAPALVIKTRQVPPRAFHIRKDVAEEHGYTRGCAGCSSWFRGLGRQPHSAGCRERFAELLKADAKFKNSEVRKREFEDKMLKKAVKRKLREDNEEGKEHDELAWDDVHGKPLDAKKVREARMEEVDYMKEKGVWSEVDVEEAWKVTGKAW